MGKSSISFFEKINSSEFFLFTATKISQFSEVTNLPILLLFEASIPSPPLSLPFLLKELSLKLLTCTFRRLSDLSPILDL